MLIGYSLSALVLPLYAFVLSPLHVLIIRFTERVGKGIRTAPRDSLIAGSVTNGETGKSFGLQKPWTTAAPSSVRLSLSGCYPSSPAIID